MSYAARAKRARLTGTMTKGVRRMYRRTNARRLPSKVVQRVNNLYRMIETKECCRKSNLNIALAHNNVYVVVDSLTGVGLNPLYTVNGNDDVMGVGGARIGDQFTVKGLMIKGFFENALARPRVFYRVMLLRGAKGETFDRTTIFKNDSNNKMIDQVNTERFSILAQKTFNINASNIAASAAEVSGAPLTANAGGVGTRVVKMWIPGTKFGRGGNVQFENVGTQPKFYDYRIVVLVYDWYGTPQDVNNVGRINELYTKLYFKDA